MSLFKSNGIPYKIRPLFKSNKIYVKFLFKSLSNPIFNCHNHLFFFLPYNDYTFECYAYLPSTIC